MNEQPSLPLALAAQKKRDRERLALLSEFQPQSERVPSDVEQDVQNFIAYLQRGARQ